MSTVSSAIDRLRALPAVFDLPTFSRVVDLEWEASKVCLARWHARDLVKPAGPRTGVYYNLVKQPSVTWDMRVEAVQMIYPSAVLVGASVLHSAGWTTQVSRVLTVGVKARRSYAMIDGIHLSGRSPGWYRLVHDRLSIEHRQGFSTFGLKALTPAMALADVHANAGGWKPDPDDLDITDDDWPEVVQAFERFGIEVPETLAEWFKPRLGPSMS